MGSERLFDFFPDLPSYLLLLSFSTSLPQQVIDPAHSSVDLLGTKAELKLRKADPVSWASLELKPQPKQSEDDKQQNE